MTARPRRRGVLRLAAATGVAGLALLCSAPAGHAGGTFPDGDPNAGRALAADTATTTPIKHFVYLMQESHSFDNYFGTYPGADGLPAGTCVPKRVADPKGACVKPFRVAGTGIVDLPHTRSVFTAQLNKGANNGFVDIYAQLGDPTEQAMGHYDDADLPYYWNVADNYVLFDRFFTSAAAGGIWNRMFWVTATPGNPDAERIPHKGFGDLPTIFDRLEARGVSWKFYVENYDSSINFRTYRSAAESDKRSAQVVWAPLLAFDRFVDDPGLSAHIAPIEEYYTDLAAGTLPSVAYIAPAGSSEHAPGNLRTGERFVRTLHSALMRSSAWNSSAFLWSYDDWGGWYDHVVPPKVDPYGYGYRSPALLVSPYARKGYVDSTQLDATSALKFVEQNWGVAPLASRDRSANTFTSAFDFTAPPRRPALLSDTRVEPEPVTSDQHVIYLTYGGGILIAALVVGSARLRRQRPAPPDTVDLTAVERTPVTAGTGGSP